MSAPADTRAAPQSELKSWAQIIVLFLTGLGGAAQFGKISLLFPAWAAAYPQAGASLGFLLSVISLMGVVLGLVAGMMVARVGFRRMLIAALALGAVLSVLEALLPPLPVMLGLRGIEGLSHLAIVVAAPTLMAEIASDRSRPVAMTLWSTYFGMAFAIYAQIGPPLLAAGGLPLVLLSHAGYLVVMAALLLALLPDDRRLPHFASAREGAMPGLRLILRQHRAAYASPFIAAPGLGFFCYALTFVAVLTVIPPYLPEESREALLTLLPMAGILSSLVLASLLLRFIPAVYVVVTGFACGLASAVIMAVFPGGAWPPVMLLLSLGLVQGGSFASVPQVNRLPGDRALSNGVLAQMGNLGNLLGTPVLLAMTGAMGGTGLVVFVLVAYGAGIAVHLTTARMRARLGPQ